MIFSTTNLPEMVWGQGALGQVGIRAKALDPSGRALVVADPFLVENGTVDRVSDLLLAHGIEATRFVDIPGEPSAGKVRAAASAARRIGAGLVVGIGGGSVLDVAKVAACCAVSGEDPMHYALAANPLPQNPLKKILVPTTAGTGSEANGTSVFTNAQGKKVWTFGAPAKADLAVLDPDLTTTLPPGLTAWCGMDAFVHAFEAATNRWTHPCAQLFAHKAMSLIAANLERAVTAPADTEARAALLLASFYAGFAIENCGTAVAHNVSHALAGLGHVHHGLATALAFEATLDWLIEAGGEDFELAAMACGVERASAFPGFVSELMDRAGIERRLPAGFAGFAAIDLAREMRGEENRTMREATRREMGEEDIEHIAAMVMALAHVPSLRGGA
jgi:alcohol dehydrogenase